MSIFSRLNPFSKTDAPPSKKSVVASDDLAQMLIGGGGSDSGANVNPTTAMQLSTVYSCVKVLSESVGQLPLKVYERTPTGRDYLPDHEIQQLLRRPNPRQTGQEFWEMAVTLLKMTGNFYAFIVHGVGGRILEIMPYCAGAVEPKLRENGDLVYHVTYADGGTDILDADKILHIKGPSIDGLVGMSDIEQSKNAIGLAMSTEKHGAVLFKNGAQPQGVLSTDQVIADETYDRIRTSWNDTHQGTSNAHRTAILESGLKYQAMSLSNSDAQFLETRKYQRAEICGIFRVPPHKIGDLTHATFSNIEHQSQEFVSDSLMPILTRIESRVSDFMLGETAANANIFVKFDVRALLRGDMAARGDFYTKLQLAGALSPNEVRALEDMNPREGGDIYLTPANMVIEGTGNATDEETSETL
jgi:HK97 family phage portal protein